MVHQRPSALSDMLSVSTNRSRRTPSRPTRLEPACGDEAEHGRDPAEHKYGAKASHLKPDPISYECSRNYQRTARLREVEYCAHEAGSDQNVDQRGSLPSSIAPMRTGTPSNMHPAAAFGCPKNPYAL